ncbi:hypothetical protein CR513_41997, partial [Mucuna pruriens]
MPMTHDKVLMCGQLVLNFLLDPPQPSPSDGSLNCRVFPFRICITTHHLHVTQPFTITHSDVWKVTPIISHANYKQQVCFLIKLNLDGSIDRYKTQQVVLGNKQRM